MLGFAALKPTSPYKLDPNQLLNRLI